MIEGVALIRFEMVLTPDVSFSYYKMFFLGLKKLVLAQKPLGAYPL
jgi:hypothetical protein